MDQQQSAQRFIRTDSELIFCNDSHNKTATDRNHHQNSGQPIDVEIILLAPQINNSSKSASESFGQQSSLSSWSLLSSKSNSTGSRKQPVAKSDEEDELSSASSLLSSWLSFWNRPSVKSATEISTSLGLSSYSNQQQQQQAENKRESSLGAASVSGRHGGQDQRHRRSTTESIDASLLRRLERDYELSSRKMIINNKNNYDDDNYFSDDETSVDYVDAL